jgi:hypothetical protein
MMRPVCNGRPRPLTSVFYLMLAGAMFLLLPVRVFSQTKVELTVTVYDSLRAGHLSNALVSVMEGISIRAEGRTDAKGLVKLSGITPGTYDIVVFHPLLDSLGVGLKKGKYIIGLTPTQSLTLGIGSARTLVKHICEGDSTGAMVTGVVVAQGTDMGVGTAQVTAEWQERAKAGDSARPKAQRKATETDPDGRFKICGLPLGQLVGIRATHGIVMGQKVLTLSDSTPLGLFTLSLSNPMPRMETVDVSAAASPLRTAIDTALDKAGFMKRKRSVPGEFMTPEQINKIPAGQFSDLLRQSSAVKTNLDGSLTGTRIRASGTSTSSDSVCLFVDEVPVQLDAGKVPAWLNPREVAAIEVYKPGYAPMKYQTGGEQCVAVVVWTKTKLGIR